MIHKYIYMYIQHNMNLARFLAEQPFYLLYKCTITESDMNEQQYYHNILNIDK